MTFPTIVQNPPNIYTLKLSTYLNAFNLLIIYESLCSGSHFYVTYKNIRSFWFVMATKSAKSTAKRFGAKKTMTEPLQLMITTDKFFVYAFTKQQIAIHLNGHLCCYQSLQRHLQNCHLRSLRFQTF